MLNELDVIYHYCSIDTFLNIIKNSTIRMSDVGKSNDYMETKWLLDYFEDEVIRQYQENPIKLNDGYICGLNDIETIKFLVRNEKEKMLKATDQLFYISCFSENGDKLSQWRGYADDGNGVSIGFKTKGLRSLSENEELLILRKVTYPSKKTTPNEIMDYAKEFLSDIYNALINNETKDIFLNRNSSSYVLMLSSIILQLDSVFYKNPEFQEEEEWRLVLNDELSKYGTDWNYWYNDEKENTLGEFNQCFPKGLEFKSTRKKIISYFDLSFKGRKDEIIDKIIIGPKSEIEESDVHQVLSYYGYNASNDISIEKSKSTYR